MIRRRVVIDTREQEVATPGGDGRWEFGDQRDTVVRKLDEADYSLEGLEGYVLIERKSLQDLVGCCGAERERFERELVRMREVTRYGLCFIEGSIDDVVKRKYVGMMEPAAIITSTLAWQLDHDISFNWCGSRANAIGLALRLFDCVERRVRRLRPRLRSRPLKAEPAS